MNTPFAGTGLDDVVLHKASVHPRPYVDAVAGAAALHDNVTGETRNSPVDHLA